MKNRLWIFLTIAGVLAVFCLGLFLGYLTEELSYDQIANYHAKIPAVSVDLSAGAPAHAGRSIQILHEGDYHGMSDDPVTAEGAVPGRAALDALRGQKYTRLLPFSRPAAGGVALREVSGCSSWCIAYWDGKHLWLPGEKDGHWRGCSPSSPKELEEALQDAYKLQKEIRG